MIRIAYIVISLIFICCRLSYSYIDPGTGNILLQVILAFVLSGFLVVRKWIANVFRNIFKKNRK